MTSPQLSSIVADTRLSPEACRVVLYVATRGEGEHEISHSEFSAVLNHPGEKRLRGAIQIATDFGYLERTPGGRGHHDRYKFSPASGADLKDSPAPEAHLNTFSPAPGATLSRPSSPTTTSSPSARVRGADEGQGDDLSLARLRSLLAPHDEPLDRLRRSTGTTSWAADIYGWYRPPAEGQAEGAQYGYAFQGLTPDEAMAALSTAISDYASEGLEWKRQHFRGFVKNAGREARRVKASVKREHEAEAASVPRPAPTVAQLPPAEQEWADRVGAALADASANDPATAEWADTTAEHLWKLHADDRSFTSMRPGDQEEHIRIRVLNAYGQKIGDPRPNGRRVAGAAR